MKGNCEFCNKKPISKRRFCSLPCYWKSMSTNLPKNCVGCRVVFDPQNSYTKYCSNACVYKNRIPWNKGRKGYHLNLTEDVRLRKNNKIRLANSGSNGSNWRGGITDINRKIRNSPEMIKWRKFCFERDKYTCCFCKRDRNVKLCVDHIKPFSLYPDLRLDPENGRTLCWECHQKTDTFGWRAYHINRNKR